jgi:hypothetical protein
MKSKEDIIISRYGECRCAPIYKNRGKADPDCFLCEHGDEVSDIMQIFADQQTAELRREVEELRKIREAYQALTGELNKRAGII